MRPSWLTSMGAAAAATLARPRWWVLALAAFLVRGGAVMVVLPIISLPTLASLMTLLAPPLENLLLGRPTVEGAVLGTVATLGVLGGLTLAGVLGAWMDVALLREAATDDDLDLGWVPVDTSAWRAFAVRVTAHLATLVALAYALARVIAVAFDEVTRPGDTGGVTIVDRVLGRTPDAILVLLGTWLLAETIGSLAARRVALGTGAARSLAIAARQVVSARGLATLALTSAVLVGLWIPFLLAAGRAWEHVRSTVLGAAGGGGRDPGEAIVLAAGLILLSATWVLGLGLIAAGHAWRATAWTSEISFEPEPPVAAPDAIDP